MCRLRLITDQTRRHILDHLSGFHWTWREARHDLGLYQELGGILSKTFSKASSRRTWRQIREEKDCWSSNIIPRFLTTLVLVRNQGEIWYCDQENDWPWWWRVQCERSLVEGDVSSSVWKDKKQRCILCVTRPHPYLKLGPTGKQKQGLTRCYRPSPCCKVNIWLQSPLFDSGDRLWCGACLAVLREAFILISSTWSRISGVSTVKTLRSPHLRRRQLVPKYISQRQAPIPPSPPEKIWCVCECIKNVCRHIRVDKPQSIFNKTHHAVSLDMNNRGLGMK